MKQRALLTALGGLSVFGTLYAEPAVDPKVAEAKAIVQEFFAKLKGELETALQAGGPASAIQICNERAPLIAAEMSAKTGWDVGRTSLKLRNPDANAPDPWEQAALVKFERRKAAGEPVDTIVYTETVEVDGQKTFRFMKAIPTAELCMTCHGTNLQPEVTAELDATYPKDQARGFALGDIRGAFTLSKPQ